MSSLLSLFDLLAKDDWISVLGFSAIFNMIASFFLICALVPGYFDARKYQKTFFLEENFFKFFFFGATLMWLNSAIFFGKEAIDKGNFQKPTVYMFIGFLCSNSVSMFINNYSWRVKRRNMAAAAKLGISEQEYWENHIAPTLESQNS